MPAFIRIFAWETEISIPSVFKDGLARAISLNRIFFGISSPIAKAS